MRSRDFLRTLFIAALVGACGGSPTPSFTPDDVESDATMMEQDASEDTTTPSFDIPQVDNQSPPDTSRPDTSTPPADRSMPTDRSMPVDTGGGGGMCPASCRMDTDCNPCRTPGDTGNYCCISGLCLYMTGACMPPAPDSGVPSPTDGGGDGGDGGGGGTPDSSTPDSGTPDASDGGARG